MAYSFSVSLACFFFFNWFFKTGFLCSLGACPGTSSCRPGWLQTYRDPPASASRVLGLRRAPPLFVRLLLFLTVPFSWHKVFCRAIGSHSLCRWGCFSTPPKCQDYRSIRHATSLMKSCLIFIQIQFLIPRSLHIPQGFKTILIYFHSEPLRYQLFGSLCIE